MSNLQRLKLVVLTLFTLFGGWLLFAENSLHRTAHAFSSGPPAGYARAPGEEPDSCAECHLPTDAGSGTITIEAPQRYEPGQSYQITVRHANADPTRVRWGFQLTALDESEQRAGNLEPLDGFTQVLNNQGPFPARQYIEHTSAGTFSGRTGGAAWTFRWTAPEADVGVVSFYAAGNHANGDGNTSGDYIYFTFASSTFQPPAPDFRVSVTPSTRNVVRGGAAAYDVTVTPLNGFTGSVSLSVAGLPAGASAGFQPASVNVTDSSPQTSVLTVNTSGSTPTGGFALSVEAAAGALTRAAQATLNVFAADDADLAVTQSVSPNPAQVNADIRYTVTVSNNGPATATAIHLVVLLPTSISGVTEGAGGEYCHAVPAGSSVGYDCQPPPIPAGQSRTFDFAVRTQTPGVINSTTSVRALQNDPLRSNNEVTQSVSVAPQSAEPSMTVPGLGVRTVVSGLRQPTGLAFLGADDFFVLEKASGRVLRVKGGSVKGIALDLAVNSASERGLLGVALHPGFASNGYAYLYWTESATGADSTAVEEVPLLGNRVDRFVWDGARLNFDRTLVRLRAHQSDAGQPARGNHNGGVLRFGPDGKLYVLAGDLGRRGHMQNLPCGPTNACPGTVVPDDQHGGPEPDDAHLSGVILRLNDDGTTPPDNPYAQIPTVRAGEADVNIRKVYAYGVRNSFGMDFDPVGGALWTQENGDDAFDEINRVEAGFNGGWVQLMGPSSRVAEFKAIEVARGGSLQQNRWPPSNIADTPAQALARLFMLPGAHYAEPEFSWKYAVAPSPIGFARGAGLGVQFAGDLFVGASRTTLLGGYLMRFEPSADRKHLSTTDARLADRVADNADKFDLSESESLIVGRDFGVTTDIRSEPGGGGLYVVSLSNGAVYQVFARPTLFVASLTGGEETPPNNSPGRGRATVLLDADERTAHVSLGFNGLSAPQTAAHIHGPASQGQSAPPLFDLPEGGFENFKITLNPQQVSDLRNGFFYVNVHSTAFPGGEIRGQFLLAAESSAVGFATRSARVSEGDPSRRKTFEVIRYGDLSSAASVRYTTRDGSAGERSDYTTSGGTLFFGPGEARKSIDVLINDDGLPEGEEDFQLRLFGPSGPISLLDPEMTVAIEDDDQGRPAVNLIDDTQFFVRQHYHDFLSREPDPEGLRFWTGEIESCGADARCREVKRVNVSAAFFLSIEFQETGYLVYRMYRASGETNSYRDFVADTQTVGRGVVVGQGDWRVRLDANRQSFADELVRRASFRGRLGALSNREFVDRLYANSLVVPPVAERDALVAALDDGRKTRARVLLDVVENAELKRLWFTRAFVLMQYYGYLRRNPDDPPDTNLDGYNFWLEKLERFGGNYVEAEMVRAFISSAEYRRRFGP